MFNDELNNIIEKITTIESLENLENFEKQSKKTLCFYEELSSIEEGSRLALFEQLIAHPSMVFIKHYFATDILCLMHTFPKAQRYQFIDLLNSVITKQYCRTLEEFTYFLEGLPEEHWNHFLAFFPIEYKHEYTETYFQYRLFSNDQITQILDNAQFRPSYTGRYIELPNDSFTNQESFAIWRDTLVEINQLFQNHEKFIEYLKPLDKEIGENFPSSEVNNEFLSSDRIYNYTYPSVKAFKETPRKSYGRLPDRLLLEKEQRNGLTLRSIPYFFGIIPGEAFGPFLQAYPRTLFKEIITANLILLHGHNMHRLQWYVIQCAIEQGHIKLPAGKNIGDLYDAFMEITYKNDSLVGYKKIWDTVIDRAQHHAPGDLHNPARLQAYLLTSPTIKRELPHLNRYFVNSFFKKIDRILLIDSPFSLDYLISEEAANNYTTFIKNSVDQVFLQEYSDDSPVFSFDNSIKRATTSNKNRTVTAYYKDASGTGIFFKQPCVKSHEINKISEDSPKVSRYLPPV